MQMTDKSGLGAGAIEQQGFAFVLQISPLIGKSILKAPFDECTILFYISVQRKAILFLICLSATCLPVHSGIFWPVLFLCFFHNPSTWGLLGAPEDSSHHSVSDRCRRVFLRGLPSWQVEAASTVHCVCVCVFVHTCGAKHQEIVVLAQMSQTGG